MPNRLLHESGMSPVTGPSGVAIVGLDHRLQWVSPAFSRMLGYEAYELIGRTFEEITHPEDVALDTHLAKRVLGGSLDSYVFEKRYIDKSGAPVSIHLTASVIRDRDGKALYGLAVVAAQNRPPVLPPGAASSQADLERIRRAILM